VRRHKIVLLQNFGASVSFPPAESAKEVSLYPGKHVLTGMNPGRHQVSATLLMNIHLYYCARCRAFRLAIQHAWQFSMRGADESTGVH
jgi:hypothetical protein